MDVLGKSAPLPPLPTKPVAIKASPAIADEPLEFSPIEEASALSERQSPPNDSQSKAERSLRSSASRQNDIPNTLDAIKNRFNPALDKKITTAENAIESYQASKEGSSANASLKIDQVI